MKTVREHLEILRKVPRKKYHPIIHKIHKKHKISKKTLFYIKEYGPHSHITKVIIKESVGILLFASIISSFGGLAIEEIKTIFISIMPLIIMLPALNDMIGDYGTIISSRFSTMLHEGKVKEEWWLNKELIKLFLQIIIISVLLVVAGSAISLAVSAFSGYTSSAAIAYKLLFINIIDVALFVSILFLVAIFAGIRVYKKQEDPNNFLIPITTSIADFGNMIILSILVVLIF